MAEKVGDAFVQLGLRDKNYTTGMNKAQKKLSVVGGAVGKFGGVIAGAFAGVAVGRGIKESIKQFSDAEETASKFAVTFRDVGDEAEKTSRDFAKNFGLAGSTSKKLLSDTGDLLSGFGFTGEAALDLSKKTNELAVDLASFTNFAGGAEGASAALTKALLGERESIKSLGIAILETDVKQRLAAKGQDKLTGTALRQARAQATLELATEQSKNAIGDYARTQDSLANQFKLFGERIKDIKEGIGGIFTQLLGGAPAVASINELLGKLATKLKEISESGIIAKSIEKAKVSVFTFFARVEAGLKRIKAFFTAAFDPKVTIKEALKEIDQEFFAKVEGIRDASARRLESLGKGGAGAGGGGGGGAAAAGGGGQVSKSSPAFIGFADAIKRAQESASRQESETKSEKKRNNSLSSISKSNERIANTLERQEPLTVGI